MRSRSLAAAAAGLAALAVAATAGASAGGVAAQGGCTPKNNIEAIVDDSQSMQFTDQRKLRLRAMELFIDHPGNEKRTLGAIEFGSDAQGVFEASQIGPNRRLMKRELNARINADNGATDYNEAFGLAGRHNAQADARIFLTDGEHTDDPPYADGHRGGPPVHVIGLNVIGPGGAVLQRIADETGGIYRAINDAAGLQAAMVDLNSAIGCLATPILLKNEFSQEGQTANRAVRIPAGIRSVNTTLSWDHPDNSFDILGIRVVRRGKTVARQAAVRKLRVTKRRGATFVTLKISRLVPGRLRFKVRATRLEEFHFTGTVELTTQVVRSRRR